MSEFVDAPAFCVHYVEEAIRSDGCARQRGRLAGILALHTPGFQQATAGSELLDLREALFGGKYVAVIIHRDPQAFAARRPVSAADLTEPRSIGIKNQDGAARGVCDVDGATAIHSNPVRRTQRRVLKREQGVAKRVKFVRKAARGIRDVN